MAYFDEQNRASQPQELLRSVIDQALCVLDIGDETSPEEIKLHRQGAAIIAREFGLEAEAEARLQRLDQFEKALDEAYQQGTTIPELEVNNPSSADTLKILWGLFSLSARLENREERGQLLDLAAYMTDFLDLEGRCIERLSCSV